jgi:hypothetical protein
MKEQSVIRTAAIMFAEDTQVVNIKTSHRKIIESLFVDNNNSELNTHGIIDGIKSNLDLVFDEREIKVIVNDSKKGHFETRFDTKSQETLIKLTNHRFEFLVSKVASSNIEQYVTKFANEIYIGSIKNETLHTLLFKFLYELLNKNISAFKKLTSSKCNPGEISVDPGIFNSNEREAINSFLSWDNVEKNKSLFTLISYCIEYGLLSNNINNTNLLLNSFRNKSFYLDNNVLYRAIGINGEDRKNRTTTFLRKCKETGQSFFVSKFTISEFKETIKHHVNLLQRVPFGKINPYLFKKYAVNPGIYEFYHLWRQNRTAYGFDLFHAHILGLYRAFLTEFNVVEDYKIPFDEQDPNVLSKIEIYSQEIKQSKGKGSDESHLFDAKNTYLIEQKRGVNNQSISDTKFYFVSTDQKLRNWDFSRNDSQPLALLPSQWMAVLLRYFSRTDDDYRSFVSFLKLRQEEPIIQEDKLQLILAGISEITEDFDKQSAILDQLASVKFDGILEGKTYDEIRENAANYSKKVMDTEIQELKQKHAVSIEETRDVHAKTIYEKQREFKSDLLREVNDSISALENSKEPLEAIVKTRVSNHKIIAIVLFVSYYFILAFLVYKKSWNTMEPITYFLGPFGLAVSYIYLAVKGHSFDPREYLTVKENDFRLETYKKFNFDRDRLDFLIERKADLEKEISAIL